MSTKEPAPKKEKTEGVASLTEEVESVVKALKERLDSHDNSRKEVQSKLHSMCEEWKKQIDSLEGKINNELGKKFREEDNRFQVALHNLRTVATSSEETKIIEALQRAKAELIVMQKYELKKEEKATLCERLKLEARKEVVAPEWFDYSKPKGLKVNKVKYAGRTFVSFLRNIEQEITLAENGFEKAITYKALLKKKGSKEGKEYVLGIGECDCCFFFIPDLLEIETYYTVKVRTEFQGKSGSEWTEEVGFATPNFSRCCVWKVHPNYNSERNPRIATSTNNYGHCTIIGNTPLPLKKSDFMEH